MAFLDQKRPQEDGGLAIGAPEPPWVGRVSPSAPIGLGSGARRVRRNTPCQSPVHGRVNYISPNHSPACVAQETAAATHVPGRELAKTVMGLINGRMALAVFPFHRTTLPEDLRQAVGAKDIRFATETGTKELFPECGTRAVPPFGNLCDMAVHVAQPLDDEREFTSKAGSHTELIELAQANSGRLGKAIAARFTR